MRLFYFVYISQAVNITKLFESHSISASFMLPNKIKY